MTDWAKALGEVVRELRKARGLKQEEFAHLAKRDRAYMGKFEGGSENPRLSTLDDIARALGIPLDELFRRAAEHSRSDPR